MSDNITLYIEGKALMMKSRLEDIFLSVLLSLANITKSKKITQCIESYIRKQMQKVEAAVIKDKWDLIKLQKLAAEQKR